MTKKYPIARESINIKLTFKYRLEMSKNRPKPVKAGTSFPRQPDHLYSNFNIHSKSGANTLVGEISVTENNRNGSTVFNGASRVAPVNF